MKVEKVQQVLNTYRKKFEELGIGKADYPHEEPLDTGTRARALSLNAR
jgi:hypothetical protein